MVLSVPSDFEWLEPWVPIEDPSAESVYRFIIDQSKRSISAKEALRKELLHEICPSHPLHSVECRAVAYCRADTDDVLFVTQHRSIPIVCVHLTLEKEDRPEWPHFDSYESWNAWSRQMRSESNAAGPRAE